MIRTSMEIDFLKRLVSMPSWPEMAYAFDNQLVPVKTVIDYAREKIAADDVPNDDELSIAAASVDDSIAEFVHNLSGGHDEPIEHHVQSYWANVLLTWACENRTGFDDFLGVVENIYEDFGCPEELAPFVRYMPSEAPDLGSREANENRMIYSIGEYVKRFTRGDGDLALR